ncbi:polysaccharide deacetylase family protein [Verrucomicrobiaceae bacterium N1E253]|uniref:Polysaccharide deacetylase family protein n=1 Tax=Oceaniferula marina TaxID=2748318 RepID=A0A851G9D7_9BACT|nr:polysaccharide deacetylase family protein [Oceaniferula marina]NWK54328.1 polysaccharide deacetylase family protein [Oceaniferula marina]
MKHLLFILLALLMSWYSAMAHPSALSGNEQPRASHTYRPFLISTDAQAPSDNAENKGPASQENQDSSRVVVLGYHDFSATKKATEMLIPTEKFRKQMQALQDLGLNVIGMEDFLAWRRGEKTLPDKSVLITIDDGWKSVYTDAYPILKEFGYPFTVFLYTNYVDGGGAALTSPMIREMMKNGCSIGSHSISHPYPVSIRKEQKKGDTSYAAYLRKEMGDSKQFLESQFQQKVTTYAYPGGFVTDEMPPIATDLGYECLFTVLPGKVTASSANQRLPRYVILGTHDYIFRNATSFKATSTSGASHGAIVQSTEHPVSPEPGALSETRMPTISANLSAVENLDPESIVMRIAGFGKVPANYDETRKTVTWKVKRRLRSRTCEVSVQWKLLEEKKYQKPMTWTFRIDREAAYQASPLTDK